MLNSEIKKEYKLSMSKSPEKIIRDSIRSGLSCIDYASNLSHLELESIKQITNFALQDLKIAKENYASLEYSFSGLEAQINNLEDEVTHLRYKG